MRDKRNRLPVFRSAVREAVSHRRSVNRRLVDAMVAAPTGFVLIDARRTVLLSNREIEDYCGGPAVAPKPGDTLDEAVARIVNGGVFAFRTEQQRAEMLIRLSMLDSMDVEAPLADGRWVRLSRSASPDGGAIYVVTDITLLKEREHELREAAQRAEAANRAKSEFLATMSHELRTPLNAVIGFSEILAAESLGPMGDPHYKEFAGEVLTNGRSLLKIINDILLLVKSESGDLALEADAIDLGELLEECIDSMGVTFAQARVKLEMGPVVGPCLAMGDRGRLRQAILNLMSNAAKFTPEGGTTRLSAFCAADKQVGVAISDTGIGMREEDIPVALAPFGQIDSSRARQYEGTGLGLTLARAIVELHCGEMRIDSAPGEGTTIAIFLPAADMSGRDGLRLVS